MKIQVAVFSLLLLLSGCLLKVDDFTEDELKWFKPYTIPHTVIFVSDSNETDTITFEKALASSQKTRGIEQGYHNTNHLIVDYSYSKGSYHYPVASSDGQVYFNEQFLRATKHSFSEKADMELSFYGYFDEDDINNASRISKNRYYFDCNKARHWAPRDIANFTFDIDTGLICYIDDRGIKWIRK